MLLSIESLLVLLLALRSIAALPIPNNEKRGFFTGHKINKVSNASSGVIAIGLTNLEDDFYEVNFRVGSRNVISRAVVDVQSKDIVVASSASILPKSFRWNYKYSKTFKKDKNTVFSSNVKDWGLKGFYGQDTLTLEDVANNAYQLKSAPLAVATSHHRPFGVFGLGPQSTVLEDTVDDKFTKRRQFGLYLAPTPSKTGVTGSDGELVIGGMNKMKFKGELSFVSIPSAKDSTMKLGSFSIGNKEVSSADYTAVLSTIDSKILMPEEVYNQIKNKYGVYSYQQDVTYVDCGATGPDFVFDFKTAKVTVPFRSLINSGAKCTLKIGQNAKSSEYTLGTSFLQSTYTLIDYDENRIGFAPLK